MLAIYPMPTERPPVQPAPAEPATVMLANGQMASLAAMDERQLHELQWEQEQKFARAIMAFPAGSQHRGLIIGQAYDTISAILAERARLQAKEVGQESAAPLAMGFNAKYVRLVVRLLEAQVARGEGRPRLFEVGYGAGLLLKEVRDLGYEVHGIEVSAAMRVRAAALLGERYAPGLLLGDLRTIAPTDLPGPPTLVFWNDVLEHIPTDEVEDYLLHIHRLLAPRGQLVTVTPNWLQRPSDVTGDFLPPRSVARGLHFKEYRLAEVARLLKRAGFRRVATPLVSTRGRMLRCGGGGRLAKQLAEPLLDRMPVKFARLASRGFAMSCTIASK
jgi:SAM-dependent methyltransferase